MKMTKFRRTLQEKLRRKFGWKTFGNKSNTILTKTEASKHLYCDPMYVTNLDIRFQDREMKHEILTGEGIPIEIALTRFNVVSNGVRELENTMYAYLSMAELKLIYNIAMEKEYEVCCNLANIN